ncbi:hypothetical protein BaRGS_00031921 [Batillaria attramentaria]|uniref:Uncharacterized protein n=1 Tax=Batillaria attramentaria TaxID=370345 RepID=A0ABD0JP37_9CAEN
MELEHVIPLQPPQAAESVLSAAATPGITACLARAAHYLQNSLWSMRQIRHARFNVVILKTPSPSGSKLQFVSVHC